VGDSTAPRLDLVEMLHGHAVADPYRWLEDASSPETMAWSAGQDRLARSYLDGLPGRDRWRRRLRDLVAPGMVTAPAVRGERAFFLRRWGDQEHPVLFVREADGSERALIDPATLSAEGTTTLDDWTPSKEGDLMAYSLSEEGDEETSLRVMDVANGDVVEGPIDRTRYGSVAWLPGGRDFFYVRKLPPGEARRGEEQLHRRVYRHRLGSDPSHDDLVFGEGREKGEYFAVRASLDGRWLTVDASVGTAPRNDVYLADLSKDGALHPVQEGTDAISSVLVRDGRLYVMTNLDAPRFRIAVADPEQPGPTAWRDLIPESDAVLSGYALTDDAIVVTSTRHAVSAVAVHDRDTGAHRRAVELPGLGSVAGLTSRPEGGDEVWIGYTDFLTPPRVYRYSVPDAALELWEEAPGSTSSRAGADLTAQQAFYRSKDGTEVPMFILRLPDSAAGGPRPTILYGYGGFNVPLTPAYTALILAWVEAGGVYAIANIRGGSEEGEEWHRAGMRERKQNVFDDFIAAAEWLIAEGITSPETLAISGGSNGGLLMGAALTQRPDLFAGVICSAPLLDMVRYERFGLGVTWNDEYGRADDPTELGWLLGYSPYHRVARGTGYPAVLFTVFESDTRVDPFHARKMCAALQWATMGERPILLRRELKVGHGARAISREVELNVDKLAFLQQQLSLREGEAGEASASAPA
jgi:prolyl oligopeptidase